MRRVASKSPIRFPASLSIRASRAIQKLGRQWRVNPAEVTQFETLPGQGLRANIGGRIFLLGNGQLAGIAPLLSVYEFPWAGGLGGGRGPPRSDGLPRRASTGSRENPAEPRRDGVANRDVDGRPCGSRRTDCPGRSNRRNSRRPDAGTESRRHQALKENGACQVARLGTA
jgi:hypothetical protein